MPTTHPQSESRLVSVELSPEILADKALELAQAVEAVKEAEEAISDAKADWTATKKALEADLTASKDLCNGLAEIVESGREFQAIDCDWLYRLDLGLAFLVRQDTGELIERRELAEAERQLVMGEVLQEPTEEQMAEWMGEGWEG